MWHRKILRLIILVVLITVADAKFKVQELKILFIGSSYFNYNDLPGLFKNLAEKSSKAVYIDRKIQNGLFLSDHVADPHTQSKINEQKWDYIILQGVGRNMAYPNDFTDHASFPAIESMINIAKENNPSAQIVYCLPWAFEDGMTWYQGWRDDFFDMQSKINNTTLEYAEQLDFIVCPVGIAWERILLEFDIFPIHLLHMSDSNHPSDKGSYLTACVIYSTLFEESCENISYYSSLEKTTAKHYQEVASKLVLDSLKK